MPRRHLPSRKAKARLLALKLEKAQYEIVRLRREHKAREAAITLRKSTPDWVEMKEQLIRLELEVELDAMEAYIDERRPKIPTLDKALMAKLRAAYATETPLGRSGQSAAREAPPHPDVKIAADLRAAEAVRSADENRLPPPGGNVWRYENTLPGRRPAEDRRIGSDALDY